MEESLVRKLEELVAKPESPQWGWCNFEDQKWITGRVQSLLKDALIVEIGTFKGKATAVLALSCLETRRKIITIDPFVEYTHHSGNPASLALGLHQSWEEIYQDFLRVFKDVPFVSHIRKTSIETAEDWDGGEIDMIWIDGLHTEKAVETDLISWCLLIKKGGIVSGHDWRFEGVRRGLANYIEGKVIDIKTQGNCWSFIN